MTQQAELLQKIDTIPTEYFGEVIDFVGYLQQKARQNTAQINKQHREPSPQALSKQFAGALRLSDTAYKTMQNSLQEGRIEWNHDIF